MTAIDTAGSLPATVTAKEVRRVVLSSYLGSVLEYYDFLLYGMAAALVFGPVFFSGLSPSAATIASLGTFAAGYVARPLGGVVFGHFGDRIGRKSMLVLSMTVMGVASFLIGLIPPASAIGSWGAVILVTLRVLQGIAVGGEWGGATLMALEHAEPKKRGLMAAFTNAGAPSGGVLGTLILMAFSTLPEDQFLAWGWRVPFLLSAVMLGIGLFVRSRVSESPLFQAALDQDEKRDTAPPLLAVLKKPKVVLLTAFACLTSFALQSAITAFGVTYAVDQGTPRSQVLLGFAVGNFCAIFGVLAYARLSDRVGRRPVMLFGYLAAIALIYPMFQLLAWGGFVGAMLAFLLFNLFQNAVFGPMAAFISEQFGTGSRYTGASLGFQLATLLGGGFTPMILASLSASSAGSITSACVFLAALAAISICCLLAVGETKDNDLAAG
ncbi:MHS family MFS transporter [Streptomyces sp. NBC_00006]|uniref:MFS transporter n=1 Tax=Streptomyces sp. NBC_00006 TaxID=2975619 RepID=UPI00224D2D93|nr:MFS transporter [Streptomyces sp. NBC_00006]MCX5529723.1 MHS family MFS transporter [Streptomyces sp. NBC_00006]